MSGEYDRQIAAALNKIADQLAHIKLVLQSIDKKLGSDEKKQKGEPKVTVLGTEEDD